MHKKLKTAWLIIGIAVFTLLPLLAGCSKKAEENKPGEPSAKQGTINMRLANVVQPTHPMNVAAEKFAKKVEAKSNGRIKITIYPARQLGDDRQLFEQVQQGSLDMAEISAAPIGGTSPIVSALQLPWLFTNWDQYLKVMKSDAVDKLLKGLEKNNVKPLAVYNAGFRHFVTVAKPVEKPDDLKGLKFRVAETPLHVDIFKALGASPTPMAYGEIYSGLQNKVIDGLEMDLSAIQMEKHYEVAKYVTLSRHFTWPAVLMINLNRWNSLSPEDKKIIEEAAKEVIEENVKDIQEIEQRVIAELRSKGVSISELSSVEPFIQATKGVYDKYMAQDPAIAEFVKYVQSIK
ncbi:MAG: TRAP transporter substrate-binding protein [Thermanaeromonas sp.]|uniref:TRAP transporter substrate-binding protein n=1 Tax=Thermanaeromonas sp. TaxID=2003697 RepID=UPI0024406E6E|nr:TRAP transporter substrate-binding protein [Thermanaeromonas sp.]MCG0278511.1 TRAP transporter substrate-binding protein [Thermanaeromonas sp.]